MKLSPSHLLWLLAGFGVWSSALIMLYAFHAVGCAFMWEDWVIRLGLGALLLAHLGAYAALLVLLPRSQEGANGASFLSPIILWTMIAALVATLLTFLPGLFLLTCV